VRVLATDIDTSALGRARRGVYGEDEIFGLSPERIQQHMRRTTDGTYEVSGRVKELIRFTPRNLIQPDTWGPGGYAAIFCRNVLIYFSGQRREAVRARLVDSLRPGGYLFLGHSEGIPSRDRELEYVCPSTYQRRQRA
jgi:chemotaxis protein methyltransferase CheR